MNVPLPNPHRLLHTAFLLGAMWASVGRGAAPCHWLWHHGPAMGNWQGGQYPSEPAQALRQGHRTSPKLPHTNHKRGVQSCKRRQRVSVRLRWESKQLLWTMSGDHSRKVQGTNKHAIMHASRQHIKLLFRDDQKLLYCAFKGGVLGAEVRGPVSNGHIRIRARLCKWCSVLSPGGLHH
jgi:hypothetical protein